MSKKLLVFILYFLITTAFVAQEKKTIITGKIIDSIGAVKNVNILNLNTSIGNSSNDNGLFDMKVRVGDSLRISSVQHLTKIIFINKTIFKNRKITIQLNLETTVLDEFELKRHDLSGILGIDTKNAPINKKDSLLFNTMNFSNVDWNASVGDDYVDKMVRPHQVMLPGMGGIGSGISIPWKYSEKMWALRREMEIKKAFPSKIFSEFGEEFFFKKLKIPEERYYHFLEYCNPLGIERLYNQGNVLAVLKILQEQSKSYLEIIKKE